MVSGYLAMNPGLFREVYGNNGRINGFVLQNPGDKVSIVTGGGTGNEPWSIGFVGKNLADGVAVGSVFTAPPSRFVLNVTKAVPHDKGVLYICTNHAGDILNYELASELAELEGIETRCVCVSDDINSLDDEKPEERRGQAGVTLIVKIAGAACAQGYSLAEVARVAQKANDRLVTYSVTLSSGYMPGSWERAYEVNDGEVEFGKGFNGENGNLIQKDRTVDEIVDMLMSKLLKAAELTTLDETVVLINTYGFTGMLEQCLISKRVLDVLSQASVTVHSIISERFFAPYACGCSVSLMKLDDELRKLYDMPAESPSIHCWKR